MDLDTSAWTALGGIGSNWLKHITVLDGVPVIVRLLPGHTVTIRIAPGAGATCNLKFTVHPDDGITDLVTGDFADSGSGDITESVVISMAYGGATHLLLVSTTGDSDFTILNSSVGS